MIFLCVKFYCSFACFCVYLSKVGAEIVRLGKSQKVDGIAMECYSKNVRFLWNNEMNEWNHN